MWQGSWEWEENPAKEELKSGSYLAGNMNISKKFPQKCSYGRGHWVAAQNADNYSISSHPFPSHKYLESSS